MANGSLDFLEAIERIHPRPMDSSQFLINNDYLRYAEGCSRALDQEHDSLGFETRIAKYYQWIDPVPGSLYRLAGKLPVKIAISLNLDDVFINLAKENEISVHTNQALDRAVSDLHDGNPHLLQVLGSANEPETIALTLPRFRQLTQMPEWGEYFNLLFSKYYSLFIGFRSNDPVAIQLLELIAKIPDAKKWYAIFSQQKDDNFHPIVETITPNQLTPSPESSKGDDAEPITLHQNFITEILEKSSKQSLKAYFRLEQEEEELWHQLDNDALQVDLNDNSLEEYYRGRSPNWATVDRDLDAPRDITLTVKQFLIRQELRVAMLHAPAGWGKSTVARRIAYDLWREEGFKVFWVEDPERFPKGLNTILSDSKQKDVLVVIDNARDLSDIHIRLNDWHRNNSNRLRVLLVGRTSEIFSNFLRLDKLKTMNYFMMFEMNWISYSEAENITERLRESGKLGLLENTRPEERARQFIQAGNGDLLAAMLTSVSGHGLNKIMKDVCQQVRSRPGGTDILRAYCLVATLESIGVSCTHRLLFELIELKKESVYSVVLNKLPGELDLNFLRKTIETRHKAVAQAAIKELYGAKESEAYFDRFEIYNDILKAVGKIHVFPERKLNTIIPLQYKNKTLTIEQARKLFKTATECSPTDAPTYQAWGILEKEQGFVDEARELFVKGLAADPRHAPTYQAWGILEKEQGFVDSARELFKQGLEADPRHAPIYQVWAELEADHGNITKAVSLLRQALVFKPKDNLIQATLTRFHAISKGIKYIEPQHNATEPAENAAATRLSHIDGSADIYSTWPFSPRFATDGLDFDQTRVISYVLAGLAQRLQLAIVMIEPQPSGLNVILPISKDQYYPEFCKGLYPSAEVLSKSPHPCNEDMLRRAIEALEKYKNGYPVEEPLLQTCHAGYRSLCSPIVFEEKVLGVYIIGKWDATKTEIKSKWLDKREKLLDELIATYGPCDDLKKSYDIMNDFKNNYKMEALENDVDTLSIDEALKYRFNQKSKRGIKRGLLRIDGVISSMHDRRSHQLTQEFMAKLDMELKLPNGDSKGSSKNWSGVGELLSKLREHLSADYVGLFLSANARERYLSLVDISWKNPFSQNKCNVYLDSREANIPDDLLTSAMWSFQKRKQDVTERAIMGPDRAYFKKNLTVVTPFSILGHTGAIIVGKLPNRISDEQGVLLNRLCYFYGLQLAGIGLLHNYRNQREKERLGYCFFVHQFRKERQIDLALNSHLRRFFESPNHSVEKWSFARKAFEALKLSTEQVAKQSKIALERGSSLSFLRWASQINMMEPDDVYSETSLMLEPTIKNVIEKRMSLRPEQNISVKLDEGRDQTVSIPIESFVFVGVIDTLIANAIEHGKDGSVAKINWYKRDNIVEIVVENVGERISKDLRDKINANKHTIHQTEIRQFESYGISLVKDAVAFWGGEFNLISSEVRPLNTNYEHHRFSFTIPVQ